MSLINSVLGLFRGGAGLRLPWQRKSGGLPREDVLKLLPIRNPVVTWTAKEPDEPRSDAEPETDADTEEPAAEEPAVPDKYILSLPTRDDRFGKVMKRLFGAPEARKIELDEFGSQIWTLCDGKHTVDELVRFTCTTYKLNRRQGEVSVLAFMRTLSQRRLIGYLKKEGDVSHGSPKPRRSKPGRQRRTTNRRPRRH